MAQWLGVLAPTEGVPGSNPRLAACFSFYFFYIVITPVLYMFPSYGGERWWRGRSTSGLGRQGASSIGGGEGCGSVGRRGCGRAGVSPVAMRATGETSTIFFVIFN